jgi:cell division transport system permease protein
MIAILLGLEFFIVFDRTTEQYEESLKDSYAMLVVAKEEMSIDDFTSWDTHVYKVSEIEKSTIIEKVDASFKESNQSNISQKMPNFYSIKLNQYLNSKEIERVKKNFLKSDKITRVETFDTLHNSNYGLFSFIKFSFGTFILFMTIIGFFLIVKQMEVWNYLHSQRMKVMDIFGASLFLRSKVLIVMGLIDAILSAIVASTLFYLIQNIWIKNNKIAILEDNLDKLFSLNDLLILAFASIFIVMIAVFLVVISVKEE